MRIQSKMKIKNFARYSCKSMAVNGKLNKFRRFMIKKNYSSIKFNNLALKLILQDKYVIIINLN